MPKFNANLSMMFNEVDFMDRFAAAAKAGFKGVEFLFPYAYDKNQLADIARKNNLAGRPVQHAAGRLECRRPRPGLRSGARGRVPGRAWARPSTTRSRWAASRSTAWRGSSRAA